MTRNLLQIITLLAAMLIPSMSAQKNPAPNLKETEDWITNTLEHGDRGRGYGTFSEHFTDEKSNSETGIHITFDGCEMTVTSNKQGGVNTISSYIIDRITLKDLDPHTIKIAPAASKYGGLTCYTNDDSCDEATISIETRDAKPLVRSEFGGTYKDSSLNSGKVTRSYEHTQIEVSDPPYAKRLAHALAHAIELCGGRPSSF